MGRRSDIILSDLSEEGCGITAAEGLLKAGQMVVVRLQGLEGLAGQVVWVRGKRAGVKFERPLYGPVVAHLVQVQLTRAEPKQPAPLSGPRRV
jgi:PilZ domain